MDAERTAIDQTCRTAAQDGSLAFPRIVRQLIAAGFDGDIVDDRRTATRCYLPDGDRADLAMPAQGGVPARVKAAGCAGYLMSCRGRRVRCFGRTGEGQVERFLS